VAIIPAQRKAGQAFHLHSGRLRTPLLLPEHATPENRYRIPLPRYEKKLPVILSKAEVKALLEAPKNLKRRAMLATMYGAGLRVSEVANLKVRDLDRERHVIWVRGGKDHKDRQVMLAEPLREFAGRVLALEAAHDLALSRREPRLPHRNH